MGAKRGRTTRRRSRRSNVPIEFELCHLLKLGLEVDLILGLHRRTPTGYRLKIRIPKAFAQSELALAALVAAHLVPFGSYLAWVALIFWSLLGPTQAGRSLLIGVVLNSLNPGLFEGEAGAVLRWPLLLTAGYSTIRFCLRMAPATAWRVLAPVASYTAAIAIGSAIWSQLPAVSLLKLFAFALGFTTCVLSVRSTIQQYDWLSWLGRLASFIALTSAPLLLSSVGYLRNGSGFQGILSHPQLYGVFLAPILAATTAKATETRPRLVAFIPLGIAWITLVASGSRTAVLACLGGIGISFVRSLLRAPPRRPRVYWWRQLVPLLLLVVPFVVFAVSDFTTGPIARFLAKESGPADRTAVMESLESSRGGLIAQQIENFEASPLVGIGFGVPSEIGSGPRTLGLPSTDSVRNEKGVVVTAVLEETGIIGIVLFVIFLWRIAGRYLANAPVPPLAATWSAFLINMGEMVFFSPGSVGVLVWLLIGTLCCVPGKRNGFLGGQQKGRKARVRADQLSAVSANP